MALSAPGAGDPRQPACPTETRAAARNTSPHLSPVRTVAATPGPAVPPPGQDRQPGGVRAFRELPNAGRTASTTQAHRAAAGRNRLLSAHSHAAATATTAPTLPPLAVLAGHGDAGVPPPWGAADKARTAAAHGEEEEVAVRAAAYSQAAPVNVLLSPLESIFQKSRFLPHRPPPAHSTIVTELPSQTRVLAVVTSPLGCGGGILSEQIGLRKTRARCSLCPARVELL